MDVTEVVASQPDRGTIARRQAGTRMYQCLLQLRKKRRQTLFHHIFPDHDQPAPPWMDQIDGDTIYARHKYPRHVEFFDAGAEYPERCFMAANRIGKSLAGCYELTCHLTGLYPDWWRGRRFKKQIRAWVAGKTFETTRDILQKTLFGHIERTATGRRLSGEGVVPGDLIIPHLTTWRRGVDDLADTVTIRHKNGHVSKLGFKAYQQGRGSFEGTAQHFILFDEEPPLDIYSEALMRTATTDGAIALTFTPLEGLSETVQQFMDTNQKLGQDARSPLDMR